MTESKELKSLLMKVKEESGKAGLKLNIQKPKIMASSPITSWQIDGKQWKQWETLFFGAPKSLQMVTAAMKLKDTFPWEKSYDQPRQHIKKQRHYSANKGLSKVCLVKAMVFPVVMHGCESWTIRKLSVEELMLLNCGVGEDSWESLGLQGDPTSPS